MLHCYRETHLSKTFAMGVNLEEVPSESQTTLRDHEALQSYDPLVSEIWTDWWWRYVDILIHVSFFMILFWSCRVLILMHFNIIRLWSFYVCMSVVISYWSLSWIFAVTTVSMFGMIFICCIFFSLCYFFYCVVLFS